MKHIKILLGAILLVLGVTSCSDNNDRYVDVNTGKSITVVKDSSTGYMLNAETKEPLAVYYDAETKDTIYGQTGEVINNKVMRTPEGKYYYEVSRPAEIKVLTDDTGPDYKKKVEEDGDIKIKDGDTKIKIDAETGEKKVKKD